MEIRCGTVQKKSSDGDWELDDGNGGSQQDIPIVFNPPFASKPKLTNMIAALSSIEITSTYDIKLNISVKKIETDLAIITVSTKDRCLIEGITISWFAYTN